MIEAKVHLSFSRGYKLSDVSFSCCVCVIWFDSKPFGAEILSNLIIECYSSWVYKLGIMNVLAGYWLLV